MSEKKDARQNLKISPELHREIKIAAAHAGEEMYTLVEKAWTYYTERVPISDDAGQPERAMSEVSKPMASPDSSTSTSGKIPRATVNSVTIQGARQGEARQIVVTPGECKWIIRFLNILHHGPVAARAIKWNLLMVLKGLGLPYDSQDHLLATQNTDATDAAARREIEIAERLIAESEEITTRHHAPRKRRSGTEG